MSRSHGRSAPAEQTIRDTEVAAAAAIERLLEERLAVKDVVQLTGLDRATVRRLRQLETDTHDVGPEVT
jgi:predicted transposase YdaD